MERNRDGAPELFADLVAALLRRWWLLGALTLGGAVLGLVYARVAPPVYQAKVALLPRQEANSFGLLGSVMELSGLPMFGNTGNEELYGKILLSETLLSRLEARAWTLPDRGDGAVLADLLDVEARDDDDARARSHRLRQKLRREVLSLSRDNSTGYMELRATVKGDPELAAALANAAADELDAFNVELSTTRAGHQLGFLEERLQAAVDELDRNEKALTSFVEENRAYRESPALTREYRRLEREVEASTTVWIELRKQAELSRLESRKELSSLDVLDRAAVPVRPAAPNKVLDVVLGACLGFAAAVLLVLRRVWSS